MGRVFALGDEPIDEAEREAVKDLAGTASATCRCGYGVTVTGRQDFVARVMRAFDHHICSKPTRTPFIRDPA